MIEKFCLLVILLAICLNKANGKTIPKVEYCNSLSCNNTARSILNNMDTSVQPCNDFLQFVCGKNRHSNDPTASKINPWKKLRNQIQENISSNDDSLVKIVKYFYKSCMITSKFDKQQLSNEIVDMIEQIGGWPVVKNDKWNSSLFNWNKTIYTYDNEKYWNLNFFDAKLEVDVKNKSQHVIYLSQSSLLQSQEFLTANFNDKNVNQDYLKLMVDVAVKMGAQYDVAINELKNCLEFGSQLVNLTDANHESMSLNDFIEDKSYMKNLEKVLNQTPKKSQANFVVWMMIHEFAEFINEPIDGNKLKSDKCLDIVTKKLVDITRVLYALDQV
ncbi:neprilysin-2-like [Aphidius gifuensis]|uniref:neprilysin-2-like n=1 Tax=Aphidius gifuensis TaxID=684658 RepID=UPI001CDD7DAF|nr:neprilysin-2-like [Aphidius gifuensis]